MQSLTKVKLYEKVKGKYLLREIRYVPNTDDLGRWLTPSDIATTFARYFKGVRLTVHNTAWDLGRFTGCPSITRKYWKEPCQPQPPTAPRAGSTT